MEKIDTYYYNLREAEEILKPYGISEDELGKLMADGTIPYIIYTLYNYRSCRWIRREDLETFLFLHKNENNYTEVIDGLDTIFGAAKKLNLHPEFVRFALYNKKLTQRRVSKERNLRSNRGYALNFLTKKGIKKFKRELQIKRLFTSSLKLSNSD